MRGLNQQKDARPSVMEDAMAKEKMKPAKNVRKPKSDKPKGPGSAYQQAQGKGGPAATPFPKK
jgi:hypothetical protein